MEKLLNGITDTDCVRERNMKIELLRFVHFTQQSNHQQQPHDILFALISYVEIFFLCILYTFIHRTYDLHLR